jgi:hypothetical protein
VDETWVAHALVESAEKFGDTWQAGIAGEIRCVEAEKS